MEKYEKVRVLGKGSFGTAILIKRKEDDALFVVKEIPLGKMNKKQRDDARKECAVLQQLHHPNIVGYIEQFENHNNLYIVMEYCNDSDLGEKVKKYSGGMKESSILYYFSQVCLAMEYLHSKHILHRDIKTMNVFLMKSGAVKLGDFGIATVLQNTMAVTETVCGTPYYFSPELCRNKPYNNKSDIWSLGILLYECATGGRHPFDGKTLAHLTHRIVKTPHPTLSSQYSPEFRTLVDLCLQKDPTRRPSIRQILAYPMVRRSLEHLEENLLLATQCKLRLKDLMDYNASIRKATHSSVPRERSEGGEAAAPGLSPGQAAAISVCHAEPQPSPPPPVADSSLERERSPREIPMQASSPATDPDSGHPIGVEEILGATTASEPLPLPPPPGGFGPPSPAPGHSPGPVLVERRSQREGGGGGDEGGVGSSESLQKIMENVSRAQMIRRSLARNDASPNQRRANAMMNANNRRNNNVLQLKPVYRSPYAQPMRDPSKAISRLSALNPPSDSGPYTRGKENPASRFTRVKLDERQPQRFSVMDVDDSNRRPHRNPPPVSRGIPAYPRKWNHHLMEPPHSQKTNARQPAEELESSSSVMWHVPPPKKFFVGKSPIRSRPRMEPQAEIDFKGLHYSRLRHQAPPQRLSPIDPRRAFTAGEFNTPPISGSRRIGSRAPELHSGDLSSEKLLESTYDKRLDANIANARSKSEGDNKGLPQMTELQMLETFSTFETPQQPLSQRRSFNAAMLTKTEEMNRESEELPTANTSTPGAQESPRDSPSHTRRMESEDRWSSQGDDEAELIDLDYDFDDRRLPADDPLLVSKPIRSRANLNSLPSVDFGNRHTDLQPIHLPMKGDNQPTNLHRHLLNSEAALYAGMSREATTAEELHLQRQQRSGVAVPMLPSLMETLRSTRGEDSRKEDMGEEDEVRVPSPSTPLVVEPPRGSVTTPQRQSDGSRLLRKGTLLDKVLDPHPNAAVLPLSLGAKNDVTSKEYIEMLQCLTKLLRGDTEVEEEEEPEGFGEAPVQEINFTSLSMSASKATTEEKRASETVPKHGTNVDTEPTSPGSSQRLSELTQSEEQFSYDNTDTSGTIVVRKRTEPRSDFLAVNDVRLSSAA